MTGVILNNILDVIKRVRPSPSFVGPIPMTARELLQKLQALDGRTLDMPIYVQRANGEYDCIKDVSVGHPGPSHAKNMTVIHLRYPLPFDRP